MSACSILGTKNDDATKRRASLTAGPLATRRDCGCNRERQLALSSARLARNTSVLAHRDTAMPEPLDTFRFNFGSSPRYETRAGGAISPDGIIIGALNSVGFDKLPELLSRPTGLDPVKGIAFGWQARQTLAETPASDFTTALQCPSPGSSLSGTITTSALARCCETRPATFRPRLESRSQPGPT